MIPSKARDRRRTKSLRVPKNLERFYKENKCRECSVVVTRMNFAKILGKFTKVKIQYESSSSPKTKQIPMTSPTSRLKNNENGMVQLHRKVYSPHPVKDLVSNKKTKGNNIITPQRTTNVLKENNRIKKASGSANTSPSYSKPNVGSYGIIFVNPVTSGNSNNDLKSKINLETILPKIDKSILPSEEWCIEFFPKTEEPKDDKVYDRIAAELEDLMYSNKTAMKTDIKSVPDNKIDDFPSILDILNDNSDNASKTNDQSNSLDFKPNLEPSDVEAMLLGKSETIKPTDEMAMEVDGSNVQNLIEQVGEVNESSSCIVPENSTVDENPNSPSILEEGAETTAPPVVDPAENDDKPVKIEVDENKNTTKVEPTYTQRDFSGVTEVIFKNMKDGSCFKSVRCPKNMKYSIVLNGKSVELLGSPKYISSLDDLQVLLQIVNESELNSLYILH